MLNMSGTTVNIARGGGGSSKTGLIALQPIAAASTLIKRRPISKISLDRLNS